MTLGSSRLLVIALVIPLCMAAAMLLAGRNRRSRTDHAHAGLCLAWMLDLAADLWPWGAAGSFAPRNLYPVTCCVCLQALTCFGLLTGPADAGPRWTVAAVGTMAVSTVATVARVLDPSPLAGAAWLVVQTFAGLLLLAHCAWVLHRHPGRKPWPWAFTCAIGVALVLYAAWQPERHALDIALLDTAYLALLLCVWVLTVPSLAAPPGRATGEGSALSDDAQARLQRAVAHERQRIAQELHDSIGSHLTGLIARQDRTLPGQQAMAAALEDCMLELRIVVDSFHDDGESLVHSLARLRYRIQPSLDQLGIRMLWNVEDADAWGALPAAHAKELLRIAQESLSNVMRHSHATQVAVTLCRRTAESVMVLEVRDNGTGGEGTTGAGHGLAGMRRRAQQIGAQFEVFAEPGFGTRVWVGYPLGADSAGDPDFPEAAVQTADATVSIAASRCQSTAGSAFLS